MPSHLDHQSRLLDQQRTVAAAKGSLSLNRLRILVKIRAQKLAQVRRELSLPGNGEDFSGGRDIFPYGDASRRLDFMHGVCIAAGGPQSALELYLI